MQRIEHVTATNNNLFTEGNPATATPATVVTAAWLNGVQEELATIIENAGLVLDQNNQSQIYESVLSIINSRSVTIWNSSYSYQINDIVNHQGIFYLSNIANNLNNTPDGLNGWELLIKDINIDPFINMPVGCPFAIWDHLGGVAVPDNSGVNKFIKLTAGLAGSGGFNEGLLINESISGSVPELEATAEINVGGLSGEIIHLINTEESFLRPRTSSGLYQQDAIRNIEGTFGISDVEGPATHLFRASTKAGVFSGSFTTETIAAVTGLDAVSGSTVTEIPKFDASLVVPTADDNRPKNISATYFMRII